MKIGCENRDLVPRGTKLTGAHYGKNLTRAPYVEKFDWRRIWEGQKI